eukprot:Awhi_evm1s8815
MYKIVIKSKNTKNKRSISDLPFYDVFQPQKQAKQQQHPDDLFLLPHPRVVSYILTLSSQDILKSSLRLKEARNTVSNQLDIETVLQQKFL